MRIALGVEYDGSAYSGWQTQPNAPSVQDKLQSALGKVANHPVTVQAAGRTDARVHALCQVVHFDTQVVRQEKAWTMGVNRHLPADVAVHWARQVDDDFHARYTAVSRRYIYLLRAASTRSALYANRVAWCKRELDVDRMHAAAQSLIGEHDFSSFRSSQCQANTAMRHMHKIVVAGNSSGIHFEIVANAFLHHMVRNIVGVLTRVGSGQETVEWVDEVLLARDRTRAGVTAEPQGLYLASVGYPDRYQLPSASSDVMPQFIAPTAFIVDRASTT